MNRIVTSDTFTLNDLEEWAKKQGWARVASAVWRSPVDTTEIAFQQDDIGHFAYLTMTGPRTNELASMFVQMGFPDDIGPWLSALWMTLFPEENDEPLTDQHFIEILRRLCVQSLAFNQDVFDLLETIFSGENKNIRWHATLALELLSWKEIHDLLITLRTDMDPMISTKADEIFHTRQPESQEKSLEFFLTILYPEKNENLIITNKTSDFICGISVCINQRFIPWPERVSVSCFLDFLIPIWIWTSEPIAGEEEIRSEPFILDINDNLQQIVTTTPEGFIWSVYHPEQQRPFPSFEGLTLTREVVREGILDFKRVFYRSLLDCEDTIENDKLVNEWWRYYFHEDPKKIISA